MTSGWIAIRKGPLGNDTWHRPECPRVQVQRVAHPTAIRPYCIASDLDLEAIDIPEFWPGAKYARLRDAQQTGDAVIAALGFDKGAAE